jgi:uncharacterized cupin superfamily protein
VTATKKAYTSNVEAESYEPFIVGGQQIGLVHSLRDTAGGQGVLNAGLWKAEPGSFDFVFETDETFLLLSGAVRIDVDGEILELRKGDLVSFVAGTKTIWHVLEPSKKFFVVSG